MRLQKYLAERGFGSRRACEEMIAQGRVRLNGQIVTEMGRQVDENDLVELDGKRVSAAREALRYLLMNKPQGVVTTLSDDKGRPTVRGLISDVRERVFPVGRLDWDTEGLLLLTNDGALANKLMHPSFEIEKSYFARAKGELGEIALAKLRLGVKLDDGHMTSPAKIEKLPEDAAFQGQINLRVLVHEGHNRLVRRMLLAVGAQVTFLRREGLGNLRLGHLRPGQWRNLTESELGYLQGLFPND
ncbi:MAG: rRNA pseudouridine synthase [Christensenellaceae bacterium]|jgi:23S rRNA pseudouridine2605 synthase|nr:rRNA pseudouridine synthase [Christensenellaceae bacterium]